MTSATPAAAIIAGGRATRFGGRDKSRLIVEGRPIIVRQVDELQRLTADVFIVANDRERFADLGLPVHPDRLPGTGVTGAIFTALEVARADRVLVIGGDLPYLTAELLGGLVELAGAGDGAWVQTRRGVEPLVACYRRDARRAIEAAVRAGRLKAADLAGILRMQSLTDLAPYGAADRLLTNVNTPDDWARLE